MAYSRADIIALDFGYITGQDLLNFCPEQILIKEHTLDITKIESCVLMAYNEIESDLATRYDLTDELAKTGTSRYLTLVKLVSLLSLINICGDLAGITDNMKMNFDWVRSTILAIRNGQKALSGVKGNINSDTNNSAATATLVTGKFLTLD